MAADITTTHLVCDHVGTHHGREVCQWFVKHPRCAVHVPPVHGSWMNQVEPWFGIVPRKRLGIVDVASKDDLHAKLRQCIVEWHEHAHPFNWSMQSVAKVMAAAPTQAA